jgi:hypothetical protein
MQDAQGTGIPFPVARAAPSAVVKMYAFHQNPKNIFKKCKASIFPMQAVLRFIAVRTEGERDR